MLAETHSATRITTVCKASWCVKEKDGDTSKLGRRSGFVTKQRTRRQESNDDQTELTRSLEARAASRYLLS